MRESKLKVSKLELKLKNLEKNESDQSLVISGLNRQMEEKNKEYT